MRIYFVNENGDEIDITLEGGHSCARILHAHGDATGRAIIETLIKKIKQSKNIKVIESFYSIDLITDNISLASASSMSADCRNLS